MADNDQLTPSSTSTSTESVFTIKDEIKSKFSEVRELVKKWPKDPEERPYESLYEARRILEELLSKLTSLHASSEEETKSYEPSLIAVKLELGKNYADADEPSTAETHFRECVAILEAKPLDRANVSVMMQACNKLGIIWAERSENEKSLQYLLRSKGVYEEYRKGESPMSPRVEAHALMESEPVDEEEEWRRFESVHTHTLYFLAQVYGNMEDHQTAANYCCITLDRQIQSKEFDGIDWALNAASLSQFYITRQLFREGRHCLLCADRVLKDWQRTLEDELAKKEELREKLERAKADLSRCWIKYSINALQSAVDERKEKKEDKSPKREPSAEAIAFKFEGLDIAELEAQAPVDPIKTFEDARVYFLFGQEHVALAKAFFALDYHASDHASIVQDHSTLFRLLSFFEEDIARKCRMHKRRIDMLGDIVNQMNPQFFLVICRQCHYELGEVSYEMADLKIVSAEESKSGGTPALNKINRLLLSSISHFENFTESFKSGGKVDVPEDYIHSYVMASLWIARAHSKVLFTSAEEEKRNMLKSLAVYKEIVDFAANHPKVAEICSSELQMCKDMVELLPTKIALV